MSSSPKSQDKRVETEHEEIDDNQMEINDQTEKKEDDQLNGDETISSLRYNKEFRKVSITEPDLKYAPCGLRISTTSYIY